MVSEVVEVSRNHALNLAQDIKIALMRSWILSYCNKPTSVVEIIYLAQLTYLGLAQLWNQIDLLGCLK